MALLNRWSDAENRELAIWRIEEQESFFVNALGYSSDRRHPLKRLEHLAGRYLLHLLIPELSVQRIIIAAEGKPYIENSNTYFSISHSFPYIAVAISIHDSIGIDIQCKTNKILRLKDKFLSDKEQAICMEDIGLTTFAWCAKEAVFKKFGKGAIDFKSHMPIAHILPVEDNFLHGFMHFSKFLPQSIENFKGKIEEDYCWAVTI